jgi:capsular exopolysaccharide synthesis family protein
MVTNIETAIEKLRIDILQNLRNIRQAYQFSVDNLERRRGAAGKEISLLPAKEKELLDITRRQKILEELYSFLLQKKLETSIGSASTISNVRVVEPALSSGGPVMPNRRATYLVALFAGLAIPGLVIFLINYLNDRIKSRQDIQRATKVPIIGEVSHSENKEALVVSKTSRRFIAEQFRIIRTNLQYVLPGKDKAVIMVTSSTSGEGKSFLSMNIGAVIALTGKKTAILEFDIRKPKIMSSFHLARRSGITNFIIGKTSFEELAVPVPNVDNLFVIPCGPIPPNPSELLLYDRLEELMQRVRQEFDMVIIDTAPVGLVSDSLILGRFADASLYVVRHNYTYRKQLNMLNEISLQNKLPRLSLVINDIQTNGTYGRYYGYGGYGYGDGYGGEYFDDKKQGKSFLQTIKGIFKMN